MAVAPDRHRTLLREIRRGLSTWAQALFAWARDEPDARHAALAQAIAKALILITKAMAAWNGDGVILPGDSRTMRTTGNRPPHDFTD